MKLKQKTIEIIERHPEIVDKYLIKWISNHLNLVEAAKLFRFQLSTYESVYGKQMLEDFYLYWGEPDQNHKKMRFQTEKTWSLPMRLAKWHRGNSSATNDSFKSPFTKHKTHN